MGTQAVHLCLAQMLSAMFSVLCVRGQHPGGTAGLLRVRLTVNVNVDVCFPRVWTSLMLGGALSLSPPPAPLSHTHTHIHTHAYTHPHTRAHFCTHTQTYQGDDSLDHSSRASAAQFNFRFHFLLSHSLVNPRNILHRGSWSRLPDLGQLDL